MARLIVAFGCLFGFLSLYAALIQVNEPRFRAPCWTMVVGSAVLLGGVFGRLYNWPYDWAAVLAGGAVVCAAAFWNGRRAGALHPLHHVIRISFCVLLTLGFYFF